MSDLAVKLFMAENHMLDFEQAQGLMYKYGLAEPYVEFANRLQFLLTDDADDSAVAFIDGMELVQDVISGLKFKVPSSQMDSEFVHGINHAMRSVTDLVTTAVMTANETLHPEVVERIQEASIVPLSQAQISDLVQSLFGEQASR